MPNQLRSSYFRVALAAGMFVATIPCVAAQPAPGVAVRKVDPRPNILFVIADDASRNSMGAYGARDIRTPNFDRVAKSGVLFSNAFACNPKCSPSRACLLTGRHTWQLEESANHQPFMSGKWTTYPALLAQAGYRVAYTGKGWGPGYYDGEEAQKKNPAGTAFNTQKLASVPYSGISDKNYAGNFNAFLNDLPPGQPFAFWFGTFEPHREYDKGAWQRAGKSLADVRVPAFLPDTPQVRGDLADYGLEVEWFDDQLGKALKFLAAHGLLENTLIIVTSDQGMPFPRAKGQVYDEASRVPLAVYWADKVTAGVVRTDFVTSRDIAPTVLEAAGVKVPDSMTGTSILSLLADPQSGRVSPTRDHVLIARERHDLGRVDGELISVGYPVRAIRTDHFLYVHNLRHDLSPSGDENLGFRDVDDSPSKSAVIEGKGLSYNLTFDKRPSEELYDLQNDPDNVRNVADVAKYQKVKADLRARLHSELRSEGDPREFGKGRIFDFYPYANQNREKELYGRKYYDTIQRFKCEYPKEGEELDRSLGAKPNAAEAVTDRANTTTCK